MVWPNGWPFLGERAPQARGSLSDTGSMVSQGAAERPMSWSAGESGSARLADSSENAIAVGKRQRAFVYAFAGLVAVIFSAASAVDYHLYLEGRLDLGNMVQVVWSTAHGHFLRMSDPNGAEMSRLGAHFDPFLALLAPLWWVWSSPVVLLVAQAVAVASGALPVYWLARKHLASGAFAVVFVVAYLLYPPTQFNESTPIGLHAVSFAIPLLLYAIWFLDNDRLIAFGVFAVLAAMTKEEIAAAVGGLGLWYALRRGRRIGWVICGLGLAISIVNLTVVIPHFAPGGTQPFVDRYSDVGGSPQGIARMLFTDPEAFGAQVASWHKLAYLALVFLPFLGLWAREPIMLAGAVPDLVINMLSSKPEQTSIFYQYSSGIVPFVVAASILGAARLRRRRHAPTALLAAVGCLAAASPLVFTITHAHGWTHKQIVARQRAVDLIPPHVAVSASNSLGAYVSTRRSVAIFPNLGKASWVLVGPPTLGADDPPVFNRAVRQMKANARWRVVLRSEDIVVFTRRA
jgi:uncharacterized membrane protein